MRIAMIGQKGIPALYGGIERHVDDLTKELVRQGHEVFVYARAWYTQGAIKNYFGANIIHTPTIKTKHLDAITHTLTATLHAIFNKFDVIHYHGVGPSLLSWMPRIFSPKTKVVTTFHCIDRYHQKWGAIARLVLRIGEWAACKFPHETIAVSKTIQNYCLNEYHTETVYIPNGVDTKEREYGSEMLYQFGLEKEKYIAVISRLVKHKGIHYLIEAWQIAKQQYPELLRNYKLAIVGDSAFTDEYVNELKKLARGDRSVVFTGWQYGQPLLELFANAALFVQPSENEGLSLSVLCAMSLGKPVLVSDIPEQKELIKDNRFWFANANIYSLSDKIVEIMKNETWRKEASEQNKRTALKYSWEDIVTKTLAIYQNKNTGKIAMQLKSKTV